MTLEDRAKLDSFYVSMTDQPGFITCNEFKLAAINNLVDQVLRRRPGS